MSGRSSYRLICITSLIILTFLISGCANNLANPAVASSTTSTVNPPTQTAAEPTVAPSATPTIIPPTQEVATSTPEQSQVADTSNVLYHDGFTDPTSGWPEEKFDNYFIGYHEPEYYHVEIVSPNYKTTVFEPEKKSFGDVTIEVKVFTAASKTAETGDFSFGIAFRRSGDNYYAFTISQRTKKWYVLKSSPSALTVLAEGTDESIHGFDEEDVLRVDSQGSNFAFYVNDHPVSQLTDADYATGEVGFYVQTYDAARVHIHYDELTISAYKSTLACDVRALTLHVRSGPGTQYPPFSFLVNGDTIIPIGISEDGEWLYVNLVGNESQGWVFNSPSFLTCNAPVEGLPVTHP
jgi:hypothetical protein